MSGACIAISGGGGFRVTASPSSVTEAKPGPVNATLTTTGQVTATIVGGSGTYTYSWTLTGQVGSLMLTVVNPTSSATAFRITNSNTGDFGEADATCTVTDTVTSLIAATNCHVQLTHS